MLLPISTSLHTLFPLPGTHSSSHLLGKLLLLLEESQSLKSECLPTSPALSPALPFLFPPVSQSLQILSVHVSIGRSAGGTQDFQTRGKTRLSQGGNADLMLPITRSPQPKALVLKICATYKRRLLLKFFLKLECSQNSTCTTERGFYLLTFRYHLPSV